MLGKRNRRTRCYSICAAARSGAHLLADGLRATRQAGRPEQYFNEELEKKFAAKYRLDADEDYAGYVRGIIAATAGANGVFGFRLMAWDLERFVSKLRLTKQFGHAKSSTRELLEGALPELRCIHLSRADCLRQAISKARAMQTGLWKIAAGKTAKSDPRFDPALIKHCLESARVEEKMWADFFARNALQPLRISYESLCDNYQNTLQAVLEFLDISLPRSAALSQPATIRQADALTAEWEERYRAIAPQLALS
jgi:LPS sulfotransferase NodH